MTTTRSATAPAAAFRPPRASAGPIVLATTGADGTAAIDVAARLAERAGTSVVVVSAVEPVVPPTAGLAGPIAWTPDSGPFIAMQRARVVRQLRETLGASVDWPVEVVVDVPAHAIAEAARARRATLVVMGLGRHDRDEWPALLDAFSRRNAGRRTALEVDDPDVGAQAQETGYTLLGATYDRHDGRVALMLGDETGRVYHLVRLIDGATAIAIRDDESGRDVALAVHRADGQTLLTFLPDRGDAR